MQKLMTDFVQIQKQTSEEMQNYWQTFINNSEAQNAAKLETSFSIGVSGIGERVAKK